MGGDPAVGADKVLRLFAQNRRHEEREFDYKESTWIDITVFALRNNRSDDDRDRDRSWRRDDDDAFVSSLRVIRGFYGVQGQTANVTDLLRSLVRDGMLEVRADNGTMGGDPAVGRDKVLIVVYSYRGREQAASVREGDILRIP
jgi:hypothetical protein